MSHSETEFGALTEQLGEQTRRLIRDGGAPQVPAEELRQLVTAAVQLYAAANEGGEHDLNPLEPGVATTDAVVMACALLKAEDLNPFDLALWFSRSRAAG